MPRRRLVTILALALLATACGQAALSEPASTASPHPSPTASTSAAESTAPSGIDLSAVPTACINLGMDDCRRVTAEVAAQIPAGTAAVYVQVGPFGCADGGGCARSLVARPQGDVTIEAAGGTLAYHVTAAADGLLTIARQDSFLMDVDPQSQPPVTPGVRPYTLGHCGVWSGIDAGGSWWDPIGLIDGDHADAINSADGTLAILDLDRATFTSDRGFTVQLVRRDGPKGFPGCM
jgi:hypothetical protein